MPCSEIPYYQYQISTNSTTLDTGNSKLLEQQQQCQKKPGLKPSPRTDRAAKLLVDHPQFTAAG